MSYAQLAFTVVLVFLIASVIGNAILSLSLMMKDMHLNRVCNMLGEYDDCPKCCAHDEHGHPKKAKIEGEMMTVRSVR